MERFKDSSYHEIEIINNLEYKATVIKASDYEKIDYVVSTQNLSPKEEEQLRNKLLLTKSISRKINGEWKPIGMGYFTDLPLYEFLALLNLFSRVNNINPSVLDSPEVDFLFDVMQMFHTLDFHILDNLTKPQIDLLKEKVARWKSERVAID
nr:MAG: hypothetical protein [Lokiarchaeota virus Ratatoskr Meg22_1012]